MKVNPQPIQAVIAHSEIELVCEKDEQWSNVGHKKQTRLLWYAWYPYLKTV